MEGNKPPVDPQVGDTENPPQPQAGDKTPPTPPAGEGNDTTISLDEARKLRSEANSLRKRLKAFEDEKAASEQAQMTDQQKLQAKVEELQAQHAEKDRLLQERTISSEVSIQAAQLGMKPAIAAKLLDRTAIEYDDAGNPKNIEALLKQILKDEPYLATGKATPPSSGGATNPPRSQAGVQPLSMDVLAKMTRQEYLARQSEIQQWMASQPRRL